MKEISATITSGYWRQRLDCNATVALDHQWAMLEKSLCIDNIRIAARQKDGFREGFFFSDSDAYKWLDAAARVLADHADPVLEARVNELISLLESAQAADGYLYTYNQIHFPSSRWVNLQVEHEHYCLGHLIEAGLAHAEATGSDRLLTIARRSADLLVRDFLKSAQAQPDGHEEIEIALLRLYLKSGENSYLGLARHLLERRGRIRFFPLVLLRQLLSTGRRMHKRNRMREKYQAAHPDHAHPQFPTRLLSKAPALLPVRLAINMLSGKYNQQDQPARLRTVPVGHAVRFAYLETALTLLARIDGQAALLQALSQTWEWMVTKRMFVTGGIGSLPMIEGFGRDYELHPEIAYAETCAAIGSMLWSWQMLLATGQARYADLFEWQLYNAASVSMALDGKTYFYDNPLASRNNLARAEWYDVPCCPSNLSRTWANLGRNLLTQDEQGLWIQQYISSRIEKPELTLIIDSGLPWDGTVRIKIQAGKVPDLFLRIPSWADGYRLTLNGTPLPNKSSAQPTLPNTACGYNPAQSQYLRLLQPLQAGDELELRFEMKIKAYWQDKRIPSVGGQVAVGRGPLIYCLESVDNPGLDIFDLRIQLASLHPTPSKGLGDCVMLHGQTVEGKPVILVPFLLWANRGPSQMNLFFRGE